MVHYSHISMEFGTLRAPKETHSLREINICILREWTMVSILQVLSGPESKRDSNLGFLK